MKQRLVRKLEKRLVVPIPKLSIWPRRWLGQYVLKGKKAVPCYDLLKWGAMLEQDNRVAFTRVGAVTVSTVFLGLDHNMFRWARDDRKPHPLLFETMAWDDTPHDVPGVPSLGLEPIAMDRTFLEISERCSTWEEAEIQHLQVIERLRHPGDEVVDLLEVKA